MPRLTIKITKRTDGGYVIACTRADGTVTWQKGRDAAFFPVHDLTHYVVETELGHKRGFYGLLAEGWDFTDFGAPWPKGKIPADADPSELIVGLLDSERAGGAIGAAPADGSVRSTMSASELNAAAERYYEQRGCSAVPAAQAVRLTDAQLARIRQRLRELIEQWISVPPGESIELDFQVE